MYGSFEGSRDLFGMQAANPVFRILVMGFIWAGTASGNCSSKFLLSLEDDSGGRAHFREVVDARLGLITRLGDLLCAVPRPQMPAGLTVQEILPYEEAHSELLAAELKRLVI